MKYKIIGDSCLDLTEEMKRDSRFQMIPLTLQLGSLHVLDDASFDQKAFLEKVKASPECPQTACPSPEAFKEAYESADADAVFVITISRHLSGSYNSAVLAKRLYEDEQEEKGRKGKQIAVIDSLSASSGQLNIALYIQALCGEEIPFEEVISLAEAYRDRMHTYFVLESLDTLRKNGRLTGLQAFFATALNIKPVMGAASGTIIKLDQARGIMKGLQRMCDIAVKEAGDTLGKRAVICHVNNKKRAEYVREQLEKRANFKEILITSAAGVATVYANDGGIVLAVG
ncbi:MAG TPA: DegV family protein [Candidatus Enterocloster excrementipullorum]|uniref:DegV family protein n=1 Tax=Candidatus Enterocloster excrementipullorum TaxID=2838559 RepID=A0A9D2MYA3_9FIRM|nr:DegV family protein [Candidatus Enterocloster excrementipullorum]